jgi:hypothetical protein
VGELSKKKALAAASAFFNASEFAVDDRTC